MNVAIRKELSSRRRNESFGFECQGMQYTATVSRDADGNPQPLTGITVMAIRDMQTGKGKIPMLHTTAEIFALALWIIMIFVVAGLLAGVIV